MDTLKRIAVLLLAAALVYAGAAALHPPQARAGINAGVVVNNPASQPVPITGIVGIDGTSTVQLAPGTNVGINGLTPVTLKGTPTVQLAGGTSIGINNLPAVQVTRDKDNPALSPFQTTLCSGFSSGGDPCNGIPGAFQVGPNQRLVIEYVSVTCYTTVGTTANRFLAETTAGGTRGTYYFPPGQQGSDGFSVSNQQVRIYADPGATVEVHSAGIGNGFLQCVGILSGYTVAQ